MRNGWSRIPRPASFGPKVVDEPLPLSLPREEVRARKAPLRPIEKENRREEHQGRPDALGTSAAIAATLPQSVGFGTPKSEPDGGQYAWNKSHREIPPNN